MVRLSDAALEELRELECKTGFAYDIYLKGEHIGTLIELDDGGAYFEFHDNIVAVAYGQAKKGEREFKNKSTWCCNE